MFDQLILNDLNEMLQVTVKRSDLYKILTAIKKIIRYKPEKLKELTNHIEIITNDILYNDFMVKNKATIS